MASSSSSNLVAIFPPSFPKDATKITLSDDPKKKAINRALKIHNTLIQIYGESMVQDLNFHPKYPFARIFPIRETWYMPKPLALFFWYLASFLTIAIEVYTVPLRTSIRSFRYHPNFLGPYKTQMDILSWFAPLNIWDRYLSLAWDRFKIRYQEVIPDEVWSKPEEDAPWDKLLTGYTQKIKKILEEVNNPGTSTGSSTSSGPSTIPSSNSEPGSTQKPETPHPEDSEEFQPVKFQSEDHPLKKTSGSSSLLKTHMIKTPLTRKNSESSTYHHLNPPRVARSNTMYQEKPNMLLDQILRNSGSQMKTGKTKKIAEKSYNSLTRSKQLKR
ncbi:hypothetical protein TIFTF001_017024 [Ficus carica]|uniref:Uncharacterized protein n=1 Tax=Ficus carica TaxID=3494 RepID=A0AA88A466_FICCA|nr:hypothetical protein TIFTF001_017024 [Ficus carica]